MTEPSPVTAEITDTDRNRAAELLGIMGAGLRNPIATGDAIARALAETREAAFAAGLQERADDAHAAGYAEGLADGIDKGKEAGYCRGYDAGLEEGVHRGRDEALTVIEAIVEALPRAEA